MFTHHAQVRMQQRGISADMVEALIDWGDYRHEKGADLYLGTTRTIQKMIKHGINKKQAEAIKGKYVVMSNSGFVITTGHLH